LYILPFTYYLFSHLGTAYFMVLEAVMAMWGYYPSICLEAEKHHNLSG